MSLVPFGKGAVDRDEIILAQPMRHNPTQGWCVVVRLRTAPHEAVFTFSTEEEAQSELQKLVARI